MNISKASNVRNVENKQFFKQEGVAMPLNGREADIYNILCENKRVSVAHLSDTLFVSDMTIRRDLKKMEEKGLLRRCRGGAVLTALDGEMPFSQRFFHEENEKKLLAQKAAALLENNMTVYIDSSSTCQYILPHLAKFEGIRVITNSLNALLKTSKMNIPCVLIGGEYFAYDMCFVGPFARQAAEQFNADIAFFTTTAMSDDGIISDTSPEQSEIRRIAMKNSKKNVFIFEHNKLGKKCFHTVCRSDDADEVIVLANA